LTGKAIFSISGEKRSKFRSILKVVGAKTSDSGHYVCRASVDAGRQHVETDARVAVQKVTRQVTSEAGIQSHDRELRR
jgi:hypothetical protein